MTKFLYKQLLCSLTIVTPLLSTVYATDTQPVQLHPIKVRSDYVEIERLRNTKQVIVLRDKDLQNKGYRTISDALNDITSINVNTTGTGDIDIRGQGSDQSVRNIQVMLDGAPITTMVNHPMKTNYDIVPIEQVEKIEIIPGGGSVLYGSGSAGGVINITTNLRSIKKPKNIITTEFNSQGHRLGINVGNKINNNLSIQAGYNKLHRNLYFKNTYRHSDYYYTGLTYKFDNSQDITFRYSFLDEKSNYVGSVNSKKLKQEGYNYVPRLQKFTLGLDKDGHKIETVRPDYLNGNRELTSYNMTYHKDINKNLYVTGDFFYNTGYYRNNDTDYRKMNHDTKGVKLKFDYNYGLKNDLLVGLDIYSQKANLNYNDYKSINYKQKIYKEVPLSFYYHKKNSAIYILNILNKNKWTFTQGIRRDKTEWTYDKHAARNVSGNDTDNRWNTASELSIAYNYNKTGNIYARFEKGFTSPDGLQITDQIKVNGINQYVATSAEDEKFNLYELGWRDNIGISSINVTLFSSYTNNQMNRFYALDDYGLSMLTKNLLKTSRKGFDISLGQYFGKWTLKENYTYLKGFSEYNEAGKKFIQEHPDTEIDYTRSGLQKVPKHKLSIHAEYKVNDKLTTGLKYTYIGSYNNFLSDSKKEEDGIVGSHSIIDLNLDYKYKTLNIYGGITNLLNTEYYEYASEGVYTVIPGFKRSYFIGCKYNF